MKLSHLLIITPALLLMLAPALRAADWPNWRGPNYDDVSTEHSGWPSGWPPKRLWKKNVGKGCTSPVIVKGRLYVIGWTGKTKGRDPKGTDTLYCLNAADGKELWKQSYPSRYWGRVSKGDKSLYGGPLSTPAFDLKTGYIYTLSIDGDLRCWDTKNKGRPLWNINFYDRFKIPQRPHIGAKERRDYGYPSSPLIQGDLIIAEVGDDQGLLMAFDKKTGKSRWNSQVGEFGGHNAGPIPIKVQGIPCIASSALRKLVIVRTDTGREGRILAEYPWVTDFANNIATPAVAGNRVILTAGYNQHQTILLEITPKGAKEQWTSPDFSKVCSPVVHKGRIYFVYNRLHCLDLTTGKTNWSGGSFAHDASCLATADDKIIVFGTRKLVLAEAFPKNNTYRELSRVDRIITGTCYPHLVLSNRRLYCKNREGDLVCLSVHKRESKRIRSARGLSQFLAVQKWD
ncbi:MAG: PQQ-binding-like beta-propeller repeat protein [Planctomycetota bacterium]|jgi:outer membrane protein assembly factor BamB